MGGGAHLLVVAAPGAADGLLDRGAARLAELEARWSRFRPDSELSVLGERSGSPVRVSSDTRRLVAAAVAAWRTSGGRFDPTVLHAVRERGYDRSFDALLDRPARAGDATALPAPGCAGIEIDERAGTVLLPAGVGLDPGGIGKGLAADLVAGELRAAGALGACVNVGGDLRAVGRGPDPADPVWVVGVEHPTRAGEPLVTLRLPAAGGAVSSSSVLLRRWGHGEHHLLDPATGVPTATDVVAATVAADTAAVADAATKIAFAAPTPDRALAELDAVGVAAVLVLDGGRVLAGDRLARLCPQWADR